jgi:hypothetical protein
MRKQRVQRLDEAGLRRIIRRMLRENYYREDMGEDRPGIPVKGGGIGPGSHDTMGRARDTALSMLMSLTKDRQRTVLGDLLDNNPDLARELEDLLEM